MVEVVFTFGLVMKILRRHHRRRKPLKIAKMSVFIWVKSLGLSWRWHRYQNTRQHFKRPGNISGPKIAILMLPATWLTYTLTPHTHTHCSFLWACVCVRYTHTQGIFWNRRSATKVGVRTSHRYSPTRRHGMQTHSYTHTHIFTYTDALNRHTKSSWKLRKQRKKRKSRAK